MEMNQYDGSMDDSGRKLLRLGGFIFLGIGLLFFILGSIFLTFTQRRAEAYEETEGVIVGFDRYGHPYVAYEADGETYEQWSNFTSSTMRLGDELTIRYDPAAPYRMEAGASWPCFCRSCSWAWAACSS